ncbi:MAG: peptide chain release factor N(5)-glutamine methyltransferase [Bacillota bacterium]|nr:peptide chain release factor N(5)-glutamine methyltransferase [Bacillota bacterium]
METLTIEEALKRASFYIRQAGMDQPRLEAELLLSFCIGQDRLRLRLLQDKTLNDEKLTFYEEIVNRRCTGEPLAYITGEKYFFGRSFSVNKNVLIPRPETEKIIEITISRFRIEGYKKSSKFKCLDLGTGSGVLAVTLALEFPQGLFWAVDISKEALETARCNARRLNVVDRIRFLQSNYFDALQGEKNVKFDLIVSNPPYIDEKAMNNLPADVKNFEPEIALSGGKEGLDGYRTIIAGLPDHISKPGLLLLEIGSNQWEAVETICSQARIFRSIACHNDLAGLPRVVEGVV